MSNQAQLNVKIFLLHRNEWYCNCLTVWGEEMTPCNVIKSINPEVSKKFCQRALLWRQKAEKWLAEGAMEDGTRHKKARRGWKTRRFGDSPAAQHQAEEASCAATADVQIHSRKRPRAALGLRLALLAWDQHWHGGGHTQEWHHGGRLLLPATFLLQRVNYTRLQSLSNTSPFSSLLVW